MKKKCCQANCQGTNVWHSISCSALWKLGTKKFPLEYNSTRAGSMTFPGASCLTHGLLALAALRTQNVNTSRHVRCLAFGVR